MCNSRRKSLFQRPVGGMAAALGEVMFLKALSLRRFYCVHLSFLACVVLASTSFARPIFFAVDSTPYDHQMLRVQPILVEPDLETANSVSLAVVNQWMSKLRRIRYQYSNQWKTPAEVGVTRTADCKAKAIALYEIMHGMGATDVRLVIGKRRAGDWFTHAWLEWETMNGNYLLDPTFSRRAVRAEREGRGKYVPLYAYDGVSRYRALNASPVAETPLRAVATGAHKWAMRSLGGLE
jgi:predicted transglutaminase-like cysteine proteinase